MNGKNKIDFADKVQICKQQVSEFLRSKGLELENKEVQLNYASFFQSLKISETSENWDDILPQGLMFGDFYNNDEQKKLKKNKNFAKFCEIMDLYRYHIEKCDVRWYHLIPGNMYRYYKERCKCEIKFLVHSCGKLKVAEVWLSGFEENLEILMSSCREVLWVVRAVKKLPQLEIPGREYSFTLGEMTPEIAASIEQKSQRMKQNLAMFVEAKGKTTFSGNLKDVRTSDLIEQAQDLSLEEIKQLMAQYPDFELSRKEIKALESLAEIQDIHEEIAVGLKNLNKVPYKPGGQLAGFVDNQIFDSDARRSAFYFVHRDQWMVQIFIKSKLRFDYLLWVKGTFMTVSLVEDLKDVEVLKPLIKADEEGKIKEYFFTYELQPV